MRLGVLAALSAATLAATGGAAVGWHYAPDSADQTRMVRATVPTGPPVYVLPECTTTPPAAFRLPGAAPAGEALAGRVPSGFVPVRAVRCEQDFLESGTFSVTRSETSTEADLQAVLAALRPPLIAEPVGGVVFCPAIAVVPVAIALVDAHGTAVRVDLPRDGCGLYVDSSVRTLGTVHWTVTQTTQAPLP
jgi:hypothetical protein